MWARPSGRELRAQLRRGGGTTGRPCGVVLYSPGSIPFTTVRHVELRRSYMGNTYSTYLEEDPNTSKYIVYLIVFGTCLMFTYEIVFTMYLEWGWMHCVYT